MTGAEKRALWNALTPRQWAYVLGTLQWEEQFMARHYGLKAEPAEIVVKATLAALSRHYLKKAWSKTVWIAKVALRFRRR